MRSKTRNNGIKNLINLKPKDIVEWYNPILEGWITTIMANIIDQL